MKSKIIWLFLIAFLSLWAWQKNGSPVCQAEGGQSQIKTVALSGERMAVSWLDTRNDTHKIYLQVIASTGMPLFQKDGIRVSEREGGEFNHNIATDGSDIFVVYEGGPLPKARDNLDIFLDRIDGSTRENVWGDIRVCGAEGQQYTPQLCISPSGESWVSWEDYRLGEKDIYLAGVSKEGKVEFEVRPGSTAARRGSHYIFGIENYALVFFKGPVGEKRGIICQKIDKEGNRCFGSDGFFIGKGKYPAFSMDSSNAFIAFSDGGGYTDSAFVQKLRDTTLQWDTGGIWLAPCVGTSGGFAMVPNFLGGIIACFESGPDVYCQAISSDKTLRFGVEAIRVWKSPPEIPIDDEVWMRGVDDGYGGIVLTWDTKSDSTSGDIMAARIDTSKGVLWVKTICDAIGGQVFPEIIRTESNFIIVWQDYRSGNSDLFAQCIDLNGNVGVEEKEIPLISQSLILRSFPNPFSQQTVINYHLSAFAYITVKIYNSAGQLVKKLVDERKSKGWYRIIWDGKDGYGRSVPSGVYFCRLQENEKRDKKIGVVEKIVLIKRRDYE